MPEEVLYTCPHCQRSGFTHRGLTSHFCQTALAAPPATHTTKRYLTKIEIIKIVVNRTKPTPTP
jgi:hypothetical protein